MSDESAVEPTTLQLAFERVVPSAVVASFRRLLAASSLTRLGAVGVAFYVLWFAFVVTDELALLLTATVVGFALAGLVPLALVVVIVRAPI